MRERMTRVPVAADILFDTCGTGGDGAGTFNISTAVAFVMAAAGIPGLKVAKHGNRAVSSRSGSADVLAELGVNIEASVDSVRRCIDEAGIGFLFAPVMHPAMRHAMPVRRELGIRTVFNVLGPLTNPAGATHQLMGVFDRALVVPLAHVLGRLGTRCAWVVHSADGLDEISTSTITHVATWQHGAVQERTVDPRELDIPPAPAEALRGGDARENAATMRALLGGERDGPIRDAVALNAAAGLCIAGQAADLCEGYARAGELIKSAAALRCLDRLVAVSRGDA
jgi:anthranilate phosphoribosyltransferase